MIMDLVQAIKSKIYHPIWSRVGYDFGVILLLSMAILWMGIAGTKAIVLAAGYTVVILAVEWLVGMFDRLKMAPPLEKSVWLAVAVLTGLLALAFMALPIRTLFGLGLASLLVLLPPRWLLNMRRLIPQRYSIQIMGEKLPVLVVGGGGYIGTHVVDQLLAGGHRVRVFDRFFYGRQSIADFENHPRFEVVEGDISNIYELTMALQETGAVVHLAGIVGDPACSVDDQLTRHINIVNTRMLKESVKAFSVPRFVFASSCSVYGASNEIVNESSKLSPVSLYARTKIDSEQELLSDQYDLFHPTILRFATVYGHSRRMRFDLVVNLFVAQAYVNGLITVRGSGQWRPFVHVLDLGRAVRTAIEAPLPSVSRQVFNVGGDALNVTIGELAHMVAQVIGKDRRGRKVKVTVDDTMDDPRNYHVSFEKIHRYLNFVPQTTLKAGIEEMYQAFLDKQYTKAYTDQVYSNVEMTKLIQKEFRSEDYRKSHFTGFVPAVS